MSAIGDLMRRAAEVQRQAKLTHYTAAPKPAVVRGMARRLVQVRELAARTIQATDAEVHEFVVNEFREAARKRPARAA